MVVVKLGHGLEGKSSRVVAACGCWPARNGMEQAAEQVRVKGITATIGPAVRADFRRLYPANAKTPTCCPSDDNCTKVTNSVTSARSLWWHVGPYFWPVDLTRTANPICIILIGELFRTLTYKCTLPLWLPAFQWRTQERMQSMLPLPPCTTLSPGLPLSGMSLASALHL